MSAASSAPAAEPPSVPNVPASPPPPPPPAAPPHRRVSVPLVIAAVVVVALLVLVLVLVGVIPTSSSASNGTSPSGGAALTYDQARPLADDAAGSTSGGSWALVVGAGVSSTVSATESIGSPGSSGCNVTTFPGVSNPVTIPAGSSNQTHGTAPAWVFLYRDAAGEMLIVAVLDGKAAALGTIAARQSCSTIFGLLSVIPSGVIDSSVAASDVASDAASFLSVHSEFNSAYGLVGGISFLGHGVGAEWEVNYTTCPVDATTGTMGAAFNATVNATTGAVLFEQSQNLVGCSTSGSIDLVHGVSPAVPLERVLGSTAFPREN